MCLLSAAPASAQYPTVSTIAGSLSNGGFVDGFGTGIRMNTPGAVATDGLGNIYVADTDNHVVRKLTRVVDSNGVVKYSSSVCAGRPGLRGYNDIGSSGSAPHWLGTGRLSAPKAIAIDPVTNDGSKVYIASRNAIVVANCAGPAGFLTQEQYGGVKGDLLHAGFGAAGTNTGCLGNPNVRFSYPGGLAFFDSPGSGIPAGRFLFVSDTLNHKIKMIDLSNCSVHRIAGSTAGHSDGDAFNVLGAGGTHAAKFNTPNGITFASFRDNSPGQVLSASEGPMGGPARHLLFVADTNNHSIRAIQLRWNSSGAGSFFGVPNWWDTRVHTVAGAVAQQGVTNPGLGHGDAPYQPGARWFNDATVTGPRAVHFMAKADVIDDPITHKPRSMSFLVFNSGASLRYVMFSGGDAPSSPAQWPIVAPPYLFTFVHSHKPGFANGPLEVPGDPQRFHTPHGIATGGRGLVVADSGNNQIREIWVNEWTNPAQITAIDAQTVGEPHHAEATGELSTLAGWQPTYAGAEGAPATAAFRNAIDLAVDPVSGFVFAIDNVQSKILRIDPSTGPSTLPVTLATLGSVNGMYSIAVTAIGADRFLFVGLGNGKIRRYALTLGLTLGPSTDLTVFPNFTRVVALAVGYTVDHQLRGYLAGSNVVKRFNPATFQLETPVYGTSTAGYTNNVYQPDVTTGALSPVAQYDLNFPLFDAPIGLAIHPLEDAVLVSGSGPYVRKIERLTGLISTVFGDDSADNMQQHASSAVAFEQPGAGTGGLSTPLKIATSSEVVGTQTQGWLWVVNNGNASITRYKLNNLAPEVGVVDPAASRPGTRAYGDVALHSDNDGSLPLYYDMPWTVMPKVTVSRGRFDHPISIAVKPGNTEVYIGNGTSVRRIKITAGDDKPELNPVVPGKQPTKVSP